MTTCQRARSWIVAAAMPLLAASAAGAATEITMYYPVSAGGPIAQTYESLAADFSKANPEIKVKAVYAGNQVDALIKAQTAIRGGTPPAMAILDSTNVYTLIDDDMLEPISSFVKTDDDRKLIEDFYPAFLANGSVLGKIWSLPFQRSTLIMYYNKDAFREVGLDPEKPPATWTELHDAAVKLTKKDASGAVTRHGFEIPSTQPDVYWPFQALVTQAGGTMMSEDGTRTSFDSPQHVRALEFWLKLTESGAMPKGILQWATVPSNFLAGKSAIMWHTTGNLVRVKNEAKFDVGVAMLPADTRRGTPVGGGNIHIFKAAPAEQKQAAWTFARWLASPERAAEFSRRTGYVAVRKAAYQVPEMTEYIKQYPAAAVARDQLAFAVRALSTHENPRVHKAIMDAIQAALTGKTAPAPALKAAQEEAERILRPFRK
jgi:sn-glycerol 3-phosphate transport system substrate-binding protein